jgi:hypothetical protein
MPRKLTSPDAELDALLDEFVDLEVRLVTFRQNANLEQAEIDRVRDRLGVLERLISRRQSKFPA